MLMGQTDKRPHFLDPVTQDMRKVMDEYSLKRQYGLPSDMRCCRPDESERNV